MAARSRAIEAKRGLAQHSPCRIPSAGSVAVRRRWRCGSRGRSDVPARQAMRSRSGTWPIAWCSCANRAPMAWA